jgi:hypothetical protein
MKIKQISLFMENKPGRLSVPTRILAQNGIDIRAMYLADTQDYGILRMIVADTQKAVAVLEAQDFVVKVTEVLAVAVSDRPGGLADVLTALDGTGINIEYMYAIPYPHGDGAILIFRFADTEEAMTRLQAKGVNLLAGEEILQKK